MGQCRKTSFDELYSTLVVLVENVTGRPCWRKMGIQAQPGGPYATVYLKEGPSPTQDVIEEVPNPEGGFSQYPVGLTYLSCQAEFFRNISTQSAYDAGIRFRQSLQMSSRFDDLWQIAGLCGQIEIRDISEIFRADVEGRTQVSCNMYADIGAPPLTLDNQISEVDLITVDVHPYTTDNPAFATITEPPTGG
jgi:hypothetical protein